MDIRIHRGVPIAPGTLESQGSASVARARRKSYSWVFAGWGFTLAGWIFLTVAWNAPTPSTLQLLAMAAAVASGAGALTICRLHKPAPGDDETE
jgi:hypothetical protein